MERGIRKPGRRAPVDPDRSSRPGAAEIRGALRSLAATPRLTGLVVVTLALGVAAASTIFSLVLAIVLRPLPYPEAHEIVRLFEVELEERARGGVSPPTVREWAGRRDLFEAVAVAQTHELVSGGERPRRMPGGLVSAPFFRVWGVEPALGRVFGAAEDDPAAEPVIVLGHGLWQRRFGADPGVVGTAVSFGEHRATVLGVMPPGFDEPEGASFWVPAGPMLAGMSTVRGARFLTVVARLAQGVDVDAAASALERMARATARRDPEAEGYGAAVVPLREERVGDTDEALWILFAAVGGVMLMAGANAGGLLLARWAGRGGELAVRAALGAGRGRLLFQQLVECLLMALGAAALGLLGALWGVDLALALGPRDLPRAAEVGVDFAVIGFALLVSVVSVLAFGLGPALTGRGVEPARALGLGGAVGPRRGTLRVRRWLVVAEVGLSVVLLVGAALLGRSFLGLLSVDPGFAPDDVAVVELSLSPDRHPTGAASTGFFRELLGEIRGLPGVVAASGTTQVPLGGRSAFVMQRGEDRVRDDDWLPIHYRAVFPDYFRTLGIPLLSGRALGPGDRAGALPVAVVNREAARRYWPEGEAVGRRIRVAYGERPWREVVGVVGDVRHAGPDRPPLPEIYVPFAQEPWGFLRVVVRAPGGAERHAERLRQQVWELDPSQPVDSVVGLRDLLRGRLAEPRFRTFLSSSFAAMALLLVVVGLYGLVAAVVEARRREIGLRVALGAEQGEIVGWIVRTHLALVAWGVLLGLALALAAGRWLGSLLHGVTPGDPTTHAAVCLFLVVLTSIAAWLPARRAARVDPMRVLREE